jgi:hypothetical protein
MQLTQKQIIALAAVVILAMLRYGILQQSTLSQSDGVKLSTGSTTISQSDLEIDTGKRLATVANSGTSWGMSPFGSGKPLTEEQKQEFKKPNTEWKSRSVTLSDGRTLYYEFGKGNPVGADPLSEKEKNAYKNCSFEDQLDQFSCGKIGKEVFGYVTPDVEKSVLDLISNTNWEKVLINCEMDFRKYESSGQWGTTGERTYDAILFGTGLNIENMFSINPSSGRKELSISDIRQLFTNVYRQEALTNSSVEILSINNCLSQNGGIEIYRQFDIINQQYLRPF